MNNKNLISFILKLAIVILGIIGILSYIHPGENPFFIFYFYTNISNILILITYIAILILLISNFKLKGMQKKILYSWKFIITVSILLVMIIFNFVLVPSHTFGEGNVYNITNMCLHVIVPILVIIDWFIFDEKNYLNIKTCVLCILPPLIYSGLIYLNEFLTNMTFMNNSKYPYFFMDYTQLGIGNFIIVIIAIILFIIGIAYILMKIGKRISNRNC